jgi:hypothetical protein
MSALCPTRTNRLRSLPAEQAAIPKAAVITFANRTARPMWVVLRARAPGLSAGVDSALRLVPAGHSSETVTRGAVHVGHGIHPFVVVIGTPEVATQAFSIDAEKSVRRPGFVVAVR